MTRFVLVDLEDNSVNKFDDIEDLYEHVRAEIEESRQDSEEDDGEGYSSWPHNQTTDFVYKGERFRRGEVVNCRLGTGEWETRVLSHKHAFIDEFYCFAKADGPDFFDCGKTFRWSNIRKL